jgi:hypothetical protein
VVDFLYGSREIVGLGRPGYFWSSNGDLAVMTVPPSGWAWLQVRIWDVQLGATYEEASVRGMGGYGQSAVFYAQGGNAYDSLALPEPLIGLQSFSVLQPIPEPSTWALAALGGTALWAGRRKAKR